MNITAIFPDANEGEIETIASEFDEIPIFRKSGDPYDLKFPYVDQITVSLEIAGILTAFIKLLKIYLQRNKDKTIIVKLPNGSQAQFKGYSDKEINKLHNTIMEITANFSDNNR